MKASVSILLILILLYIMRDKYGQILGVLKNTNGVTFIAGFAVFLTAIAIGALRLMYIIKAHEGIRITYPEVLSLTLIGYFFNNFLPTSIGGDVVKGYYLSRKTGTKTEAFTMVFIDRAIGLFTMVFMAFIALFFFSGNVIDKHAKNMIYAIAAGSALIILFIANKKLARKFSFLLKLVRPAEEKILKAYEAVHKYRHHNMLMLQSFSISVMSQLIYFLSIGLTALSIGIRIPVLDILLRMPIVSAISLLPSINGLGVREGATVVLFGPLVGKANAFALMILIFFGLILTSILGGIVYAFSPQFKMRLTKEMLK